MISRALAPVDRTAEISVAEVGEALALSYLAYYNAEAVQPRVNTAYTRAWGLDSLRMFARSLPRPGFVAATATLEHRKHLHVAIEGTTSITQLAPLVEAVAHSNISGLRYVYSFFKTQADAIWGVLHADNTIAAQIADGAYMFTFSGHSLGAACADIIACRFRTTYPTKNVRLIKFGSPRVGNSHYVNRTGSTEVRRHNVYVEGDPVHEFPSPTILAAGALNALQQITGMAGACESWFYNMQPYGGMMRWTYQPLTQDSAHFLDAFAATQTITETNPWYRHLMKTYRLAFMNLCAMKRDMLTYRFNYLEHNDENTWQTRHSPGTRIWSHLDGLSVTPPDEVEPISGEVGLQAQDTESTGTGGNWDSMEITDQSPVVDRQIVPTLPPPIATAYLPRRRFQRARPN